MRCRICDKQLNDNEIAYNPDHDEFDPCGECLAIIDEVFDDHLDEDQIVFVLDRELSTEDQEE